MPDTDLISEFECRAENKFGRTEMERVDICFHLSETVKGKLRRIKAMNDHFDRFIESFILAVELKSKWEKKMRKKAESSTHKLPHRARIHLNRKEVANHFHHYHRHSSPNGTVGHLSRKHHGPTNESHSAWYRDYLDRKRTLASQGNIPRIHSSLIELGCNCLYYLQTCQRPHRPTKIQKFAPIVLYKAASAMAVAVAPSFDNRSFSLFYSSF